MVVEDIEKIKQEYTDKYVVVDGDRPELARFRDHVGQVKTVNMSGRALVEFIDYYLNIGWHDIDVDYLKIVDKPAPKVEKPAARKPAEAAAAPAAKKPAAVPGEKKLSPLEMARMQGAAKAGGAAAAPAEKPKPAKPAGGRPSVAEMMAAARAEKSGGAAAPALPAAEEPPAEAPAPAPAKAATGGIVKVDRKSMSIAEMIAYCREHDAK